VHDIVGGGIEDISTRLEISFSIVAWATEAVWSHSAKSLRCAGQIEHEKEKEKEKERDDRSETLDHEEKLPEYDDNEASDWEKYGSDDEGDYVQITVD
jgi:hypothetical protein